MPTEEVAAVAEEVVAVEEAREEGGGGAKRSSLGCRCDFCGEERALVYCRADGARLCLACDRHVHAANTVSSKHPRSLLCDACLSAPSSVLCASHRNLLLCPNCDFDAHRRDDGSSSSSASHDRRPVEPFSGCPNAVELLSLLGIGEEEKSLLAGLIGDDGGGGGGDYEGFSLLLSDDEGWVWETPPILSLDDLIVPTSSCHGFQAMGVPPLPKNRNSACGRHKEEILRQLRELVKLDSCVSNDFGMLEPEMGFQPPLPLHRLQPGNMVSEVEHDAALIVTPSCEASGPREQNDYCEAADAVPSPCKHLFESFREENLSFLDGPTDVHGSGSHGTVDHTEQGHPISKENPPSLPPKGGPELSGPDRDSALSRYKEKRKTRRYDKHIRYESRKARADSRTRIKGRFAKVNRNTKS